ncbi:MAG: bifunctional 2-C-methyl-D-erythritol 4-phosphate cytidylyltransferase/2-C-methyl-D-erythritol 2,4-cyclodiphosphate synthase [Helicobacter sp.]|nr:bifunctional 2-C-methyl-D-erythritol 4-phosphate cytidylyltransferase/2-C-methyl-D-erythritol 2,4-cyclodiphosphate synthase [Helicobacter sp.]
MREIALVLLAAGEGRRFSESSDIHCKKQWLRVGALPLWCFVMRQFHALHHFGQTVVAISPQEVRYAQSFIDEAEVVGGGSTRQESLLNALQKVDCEWVLVSDAARCCVDRKVLKAVLNAPIADCVVPFVSAHDTTYSSLFGYLPRESLKLIQTPQLCRKATLLDALSTGEFSDESSAIYAHGGAVEFVAGSSNLHKLTTFQDLALLELPSPNSETLVGNGFDVHRFTDGDHLTICGVWIPFSHAFEAHSDGDVGIHALIDALLGAAGAGDIGQWFPDSDMQYENIDSALLLQQVLCFIRNVGFFVVNVDLTIIAQEPKIAPHKDRMRARLSSLLEIPAAKLNIKATTTEHLGFLGRCEGVAASCVATLQYVDWRQQK